MANCFSSRLGRKGEIRLHHISAKKEEGEEYESFMGNGISLFVGAPGEMGDAEKRNADVLQDCKA